MDTFLPGRTSGRYGVRGMRKLLDRVFRWDEQTLAGRFFAENEGFNFGPVAYDIYYLYGPNAKWEQKPSPLVGSGYTVLGKSGRLLEDINKLLGP